MLCGTDIIMQTIPHIRFWMMKYFVEYYKSQRTLSWILIKLCAKLSQDMFC